MFPELSPVFHLVVEFCQETLTVFGFALGCFAHAEQVQDQGVIHGGGEDRVMPNNHKACRLQLVNFILHAGQDFTQAVEGGWIG